MKLIKCSQCAAEIIPGPEYWGKYWCKDCVERIIEEREGFEYRLKEVERITNRLMLEAGMALMFDDRIVEK